jgi:hypothetical protein
VTGKWSIDYGAPKSVGLITNQVADFEAALDEVVRQAVESGVGVRLDMREELVEPIQDPEEVVQPSFHPYWRLIEQLGENLARMSPPPITGDIDYSFTVAVDPNGSRWCLVYGAPWGEIKASHCDGAERRDVSTRHGTSWDTMLSDFFIDAEVARRAALEFFEHRTLSSEVTWVDESPLAP